MIFLLKKILTPFFYPLTFITLFFFIAVILLLFSKREKRVKALIVFCFILLICIEYGLGFNSLLFLHENKFTPVFKTTENHEDFKGVKWVVVLGGGINEDLNVGITSVLNSSTLSRVVEGVRIHRKITGSKIIVSGGKVWNDISEAKMMRQLAMELGVNSNDIILEEFSRDTKDQALKIKEVISGEKFFLVTSAYHMYRALKLFQKQGLHAIAAPTDYLVHYRKNSTPGDYFPSSRKIWKSEKIIKEYLGIVWAKLRNQI